MTLRPFTDFTPRLAIVLLPVTVVWALYPSGLRMSAIGTAAGGDSLAWAWLILLALGQAATLAGALLQYRGLRRLGTIGLALPLLWYAPILLQERPLNAVLPAMLTLALGIELVVRGYRTTDAE